MPMSPAPLMLSVSGLRGIVGESLTPEVAARYVRAAVHWFDSAADSSNRTIVLARDGRKGGSALADCVRIALSEAGSEVLDLGIAMTPTAGLVVKQNGCRGGLVITASHNPAEWNGLKIITSEGAAPNSAQARQIIELFQTEPARPLLNSTHEATRDDSSARVHVRSALAQLASLTDVSTIARRQFHIVADSVNASGSHIIRILASDLNWKLTHLNCDDSGVFPHAPEPTAENLTDLCAQVRTHRADVGFAQDPDGDRLAIVDDTGRYIGEEYTLALAAESILSMIPSREARTATLVANLSTSRMIDDIAARHGARVLRSAVGEANVWSVMKSSSALLGGEGNGGVIWPAVVPIRDSVSAIVLVLSLIARRNEPLSRIVDSLPRYAIEKRKVEIREGLAQRAFAAVEKNWSGATFDRQDGLRADFDAPSAGSGASGGRGRAWLHVRASNTEPILRLIAEAPTAAESKQILDRAQSLIAGA